MHIINTCIVRNESILRILNAEPFPSREASSEKVLRVAKETLVARKHQILSYVKSHFDLHQLQDRPEAQTGLQHKQLLRERGWQTFGYTRVGAMLGAHGVRGEIKV